MPEQIVALLALPAYNSSRLSPDAPELLERLFHINVIFTIGRSISWIAGGPLVALGWLARALCAAGMAAGLADSSRGRNKQGLALVAGAANSLRGGLIGELVAVPGGDGEELLLLGLLNSLRVLGLVARRLLLGVPRAVLAALVLALHADLVVAVQIAAEVAAAVDAHADGLLDAGDQGRGSSGSEPLVRLEGQAVFGEEGAGALLLHGPAVEGWGGRGGCWCRCWRGSMLMGAGGGSEVVGGSRTAADRVSGEG